MTKRSVRTIWSRTQPGATELALYFGDVNWLASLLAMQKVSVRIWWLGQFRNRTIGLLIFQKVQLRSGDEN